MATPPPATRNRHPDKRVLVARLTEEDVGRLFDLLGAEGRRPVGTANWIAHSPFREDRHRSFTIRKADGVWHDKATGEGGSLFDAVMRLRGCTFPEALTWVFAQVDVMLAVGPPPAPAPPPGTSGGTRRQISRWLPIPAGAIPPPPDAEQLPSAATYLSDEPEPAWERRAGAGQLPFPWSEEQWGAPARSPQEPPPRPRGWPRNGGQA